MAVSPLVSHQDEGMDGKDSFAIGDSYGQKSTIEPLSKTWSLLKGAAVPKLEALTLQQPTSNKQSRQGYQDMAPWPKSGGSKSPIYSKCLQRDISAAGSLRAETSWGHCISYRKFNVSLSDTVCQHVLLSGQTSCKPTCLSGNSACHTQKSLEHTG